MQLVAAIMRCHRAGILEGQERIAGLVGQKEEHNQLVNIQGPEDVCECMLDTCPCEFVLDL